MNIGRIVFFTIYYAAGGWLIGTALNAPVAWTVFGAIIGVGVGINNRRHEDQDSSQASKPSITNSLAFRMVSGAIQMATIGAIIGNLLGDIEGIIIGGFGGLLIGIIMGILDT